MRWGPVEVQEISFRGNSGFNFKFTNYKDQEAIQTRTCEPKKKAPSTIRRNAARRQKFLDKKKDTSLNSKSSEDLVQCYLCDFQASCNIGLRKHTEKEHRLIPQLDDQEDLFEEETDNLVKAMIVSTNSKSAKQELREYYIKKLEPNHDGYLKYIEEESANLYKGGDSFYSQGDHQEHFFKFKVSKTFSGAEVQETIKEDAVKELVFLS